MLIKHSLLLRLAAVILITSLLAGMGATRYYYGYVIGHETSNSLNAVDQLQRTVSTTASIAAYLNDKDLAQEVINGLLKNDLILAAQITGNEGPLAASERFSGDNANVYRLEHPFFSADTVGNVYLVPNLEYIEQNARAIAKGNTQSLILVTLFVLVTFLVIAYFIITKPLSDLSRQLAVIVPGDANRLSPPPGHNAGEIGSTTRKINQLLDKTQMLFEQERALRLEVETLEKRLRLLFEHSSSCLILARPNGEVVLYNESTQKLFDKLGIAIKDNYRHMLNEVFIAPDIMLQSVTDSLLEHGIARGEFQLHNNNSKQECWVHVIVTHSDSDDESYLQIFIYDISEQKAELESLNIKANYDQLTGILNRQGAEKQIQHALHHDKQLAVMLLDLDGFKPINDIYGHDTGDKMLKHVAARLSHCLRKDDICARWGGDEFVVAVKNTDPDILAALASKLQRELSTPLLIGRDNPVDLKVGASIGIAISPLDGSDLHSLIKYADQAMYRVKQTGKRAALFYQNLT